ncbi:MAG: hypothetical protein K2X09_05660 [Rickettsiales bacterium]|nr:hypothetical protein [Rickettsiales bacterium]
MSAHHKPDTAHLPFTWFTDAAKVPAHGELIALTRDICRGAELCMQVAMMDGLDRQSEQATLFTTNEVERLTLLSVAALRLLGDRAEATIDAINDAAAGGAV